MPALKEKAEAELDSTEIPQELSHNEAPYTVYSKSEKYVLVFLSASIAFWSSVGSPIYYPALEILEDHFEISEELVNISVVVYMACQGISPSILGGLADQFGRRPVLLISLIFFILTSAIIAVIDNYPALLVLRCLQSSAISPSVAISAGIAGDYTERFERGWFVGIVTGLAMMGQAFGALIGAGLIAGFDWRAIFWFLTIGGGITFIINALLLPETKRSIAGNGSIRPLKKYSIAPIMLLPYYRKKWHQDEPDYETIPPKTKTAYLATFKIVARPEVSLCLLSGAIHYATWTVLLTCLTSQLTQNYGYSVMEIGLCYLPAGLGGLIGSFVCGRTLDFVYKIHFARFREKLETGEVDTDTPFNILRSRILVAFPFTILTDCFALIFGWCLYKQVNIAAILVSEFIVCMGCMALIGINTTLLVDLYPSNSSAASSAVNLTRCLCGALFVAVLTSMNRAMTIGGTFSLLSVLGMISTGLLIIPMKYGMKWSIERQAKE